MTKILFLWAVFAFLTGGTVLASWLFAQSTTELWGTVWLLLAAVGWTVIGTWMLVSMISFLVEIHDRLPG